jgi:hypothetical protein
VIPRFPKGTLDFGKGFPGLLWQFQLRTQLASPYTPRERKLLVLHSSSGSRLFYNPNNGTTSQPRPRAFLWLP